MCGRYYVHDDLSREIEKLVRNLDPDRIVRGEIFPDQRASVIVREKSENELEQMEWGFRLPERKQLLINARAETAERKRTFAGSLRSRRCLVPASWFYEWDAGRSKVAFKPGADSQPGLFLGGIWEYMQEEKRFVILTVPADEAVRPVHDRMPLILPQGSWEDWLGAGDQYVPLLTSRPGTSLASEGYYQETLPF